MALDTWLMYLVASIALSVTPGPNGLLALTSGALYGVQRTGVVVLGGALGFTLVIALSMVGIGALLQTSSNVLLIMKWVGGAYLVWLGIQVWRSPQPQVNIDSPNTVPSYGILFRRGFLSAVSNPKAILFFGAFLTQFIDPNRSLWLQFLIMVATFVIVEIVYEFMIAALANKVRSWLQRSGRRFNQACGAFFAAIGLSLPFSS